MATQPESIASETTVATRSSVIWGRMPLWRVLALIVLVTAIPLIFATYISLTRLSDNERSAIEQSLMLSAKILAGLVDNEIDTHDAVVKLLAQSQSLEREDLQAFWEEARRAMEVVPGAWLSVNDLKGQPLLSTLLPYGTALPRRADVADLLNALGDDNGRVSDLRERPVSRVLAASIDLPSFKNGKPKYILSMSLIPARFFALVKDRFTRGEFIGVLDRNLRFVARLPDHEGRVGALASEGWREGIARAREGFTYNRSLEGTMTINAYTTTLRGWTVGVAQPESAVISPGRSVLARTVWIAIVLTAASLLLAAWIARHTSQGIQQLASAAVVLGERKPLPAVEPPFREAALIEAALQDASRLVARAQADLEAKVAERTRELSEEMQRREQTEAQARQLLRMQAIGQLTGGIAHDFNNMLSVVISSLTLLQRRLEAGRTDVRDLVAAGIDGAQRAALLTQRLLAFARQMPLSPEPLDANKLVRGLGDLIPRMIGEHIRVETVAAAGLWTVYADASQLESAIINLAVNARDAMPDGGKLTIETSNSYLDEQYARAHADVESGQYVLIAVTDTGSGMSQETVDRAFEPFFTTKSPGAGTGLGLSQVYGFVKQSRGHAKIYSEPGHGTTVKVYLPRHMGRVPAPAVEDAPKAERGSASECILVVEDEARVRQLTAETLRELGYRVLEADGASAALQHLEADADKIALLFTDIVMPDVNGRKLAERAVLLKPGLKVLFTTGFTRNAIIHNGTLDAGIHFIAKPFTIDALARKVREVLDSGEKP